MKKKYVKPTMEMLEMPCEGALLSGSSDSWWKEPETPEGCESAWSCHKWGED